MNEIKIGNIIFIAGVYGVGKSSICKELSLKLNIPYFSSSELISKKVNEGYGAKKTVKSKTNNQKALIESVNLILEKNSSIILDGHFCIMNPEGKIEKLPMFVFRNINLSRIVLLKADNNIIVRNLAKRDKFNYKIEYIKRFQLEEEKYCMEIAQGINVPCLEYAMKYNGNDSDRIKELLTLGEKT